jgi:VIT1/CCC1 family predicted Fe2+/Mn2+ transporter
MKASKGGTWKDKLLKKFENLSRKDLDFKLGEEKAMIEILSRKVGKSSQEMLNLIITL